MIKDRQIKPRATELLSSKARSLAEIKQTLKAHMPDLARRYKIKSLGIFGSYVRDEAKGTSDVDLLVEFSDTPDIFKFMDLEEDLAALLGVKVDLVTRPALKGNRGNRILQEVVSI
jgi:predicted nucleotidyltransferase